MDTSWFGKYLNISAGINGFIFLLTKLLVLKAELPKVGIFFALNFLPWEFSLIKKLEIEKTKTTPCATFKTDNKSDLSFFDFQLFYWQKIPGKEIESGLAGSALGG